MMDITSNPNKEDASKEVLLVVAREPMLLVLKHLLLLRPQLLLKLLLLLALMTLIFTDVLSAYIMLLLLEFLQPPARSASQDTCIWALAATA